MSKHAALEPPPGLGTLVSPLLRPYQLLSENKQAFNMLAPAEVASSPEAIARQFFRQSRRFLNLQRPFRQRIGRETREINSRIPADLAMHRQIRRHHRQSARHRFNQRMSKGFGISRGYVNVAGTIEMMQRAIGNRSELDDVLASPKIVYDRRGRLGSISPRILARFQLAGKKEFHLLSMEATAQDGYCPE